MNIDSIDDPRALLDWVKSKGYVTFETKSWDLNIIGVRRSAGTPDRFDDAIFAVYKDDGGNLRMKKWTVTTDPGLYWMLNPMNVSGTACMVPGQYRGAWQIGDHRGKPALVQVRPIKMYRDRNRNEIYDFDPSTISEGLSGINLHRAGASSTRVDKWSAGCQVWAKESEFEEFIELCRKQVNVNGYRTFTYTLLLEE